MPSFAIPPEKHKGRRISKQLCRAAVIFEVLMQLDEASCRDVYEIAAEVLPGSVCERTIRRDLHALLAVGFVGFREQQLATPHLPYKTYRLWHLASPGIIRDRIGKHKRAIKRRLEQ